MLPVMRKCIMMDLHSRSLESRRFCSHRVLSHTSIADLMFPPYFNRIRITVQ